MPVFAASPRNLSLTQQHKIPTRLDSKFRASPRGEGDFMKKQEYRERECILRASVATIARRRRDAAVKKGDVVFLVRCAPHSGMAVQ